MVFLPWGQTPVKYISGLSCLALANACGPKQATQYQVEMQGTQKHMEIKRNGSLPQFTMPLRWSFISHWVSVSGQEQPDVQHRGQSGVLGEEGAGLPPCLLGTSLPALCSRHLECLQGSVGRTACTSLANSFCADVTTLIFSTHLILSALYLLENPQFFF